MRNRFGGGLSRPLPRRRPGFSSVIAPALLGGPACGPLSPPGRYRAGRWSPLLRHVIQGLFLLALRFPRGGWRSWSSGGRGRRRATTRRRRRRRPPGRRGCRLPANLPGHISRRRGRTGSRTHFPLRHRYVQLSLFLLRRRRGPRGLKRVADICRWGAPRQSRGRHRWCGRWRHHMGVKGARCGEHRGKRRGYWHTRSAGCFQWGGRRPGLAHPHHRVGHWCRYRRTLLRQSHHPVGTLRKGGLRVPRSEGGGTWQRTACLHGGG